jgi:trimethylamine--corrinoid protein Co-methyltransferase
LRDFAVVFSFFYSSRSGFDLTGARAHAGSGGASPNIVDMSDGLYRAATLADLTMPHGFA